MGSYTRAGAPELGKSLTTGGRSWTRNCLVFDNSYFTDMGNKDPEVVALPTDQVLRTDASFKTHFEAFAKDQAAFFRAYADSHRRLSELGSKFEPAGGIYGV